METRASRAPGAPVRCSPAGPPLCPSHATIPVPQALSPRRPGGRRQEHHEPRGGGQHALVEAADGQPVGHSAVEQEDERGKRNGRYERCHYLAEEELLRGHGGGQERFGGLPLLLAGEAVRGDDRGGEYRHGEEDGAEHADREEGHEHEAAGFACSEQGDGYLGYLGGERGAPCWAT